MTSVTSLANLRGEIRAATLRRSDAHVTLAVLRLLDDTRKEVHNLPANLVKRYEELAKKCLTLQSDSKLEISSYLALCENTEKSSKESSKIDAFMLAIERLNGDDPCSDVVSEQFSEAMNALHDVVLPEDTATKAATVITNLVRNTLSTRMPVSSGSISAISKACSKCDGETSKTLPLLNNKKLLQEAVNLHQVTLLNLLVKLGYPLNMI